MGRCASHLTYHGNPWLGRAVDQRTYSVIFPDSRTGRPDIHAQWTWVYLDKTHTLEGESLMLRKAEGSFVPNELRKGVEALVVPI